MLYEGKSKFNSLDMKIMGRLCCEVVSTGSKDVGYIFAARRVRFCTFDEGALRAAKDHVIFAVLSTVQRVSVHMNRNSFVNFRCSRYLQCKYIFRTPILPADVTKHRIFSLWQ